MLRIDACRRYIRQTFNMRDEIMLIYGTHGTLEKRLILGDDKKVSVVNKMPK